TLTAIVDLDVAVDVEPIVDLDVDRTRFFEADPETTRRSTYKVKDGVDVYGHVKVNVLRQRQRQPPRLHKDVPGRSATPPTFSIFSSGQRSSSARLRISSPGRAVARVTPRASALLAAIARSPVGQSCSRNSPRPSLSPSQVGPPAAAAAITWAAAT